MRGLMVQKMKQLRPSKSKEVADEGRQTLPQPAAKSTPDTRKKPRESTASPEVSAAKKPTEKRPKASNKEKEWVEVPERKDLRKKKKQEKKLSRTQEKPRRARPEAVLIKPAEGMSYASILRGLKKRVNPDELGATVQGIRETRSKELIVELKCSKKDRERLDIAFREAVGASGTVRHLIPRIEVEIADLDPSIEARDVEEALPGFFEQDSEMEFRVSLTKTPYRGNKKAYVLWEEAGVLKLLKAVTSRLGGYLAGCAGESSSTGATAALALAIWQRTEIGRAHV